MLWVECYVAELSKIESSSSATSIHITTRNYASQKHPRISKIPENSSNFRKKIVLFIKIKTHFVSYGLLVLLKVVFLFYFLALFHSKTLWQVIRHHGWPVDG